MSVSNRHSDDLEVYVYRGNKGEQVPETVERLVIEEGVQELPDGLLFTPTSLREVSLPNGLITIGDLAFAYCKQLLEIRICSTVQVIGMGAFNYCDRLTKVHFECDGSLTAVWNRVFRSCISLERIKLPSSVTFVGESAFHRCNNLVEANLSKTGVATIGYGTFMFCVSLQTISLPNTVKRIGVRSFQGCEKLVSVVIPFESQAIAIGRWSFGGCKQLANIALPKKSTAHSTSFGNCSLLQTIYGTKSSQILAGLIGRFENLPIHRLCYDSSAMTEVQQDTAAVLENMVLLDQFGMTPFHILFSTSEPSMELLDALLDSLPNETLKWKDGNGRRPLDYLVKNWTDGTKCFVERALDKSMMNSLSRWGLNAWREDMQGRMQAILDEDDQEPRKALCNQLYSTFEHYENLQATSVLEMALWKWKLKCGRKMDGTKHLPSVPHREESRCLSGADIVIPAIANFLGIPQASAFGASV